MQQRKEFDGSEIVLSHGSKTNYIDVYLPFEPIDADESLKRRCYLKIILLQWDLSLEPNRID